MFRDEELAIFYVESPHISKGKSREKSKREKTIVAKSLVAKNPGREKEGRDFRVAKICSAIIGVAIRY